MTEGASVDAGVARRRMRRIVAGWLLWLFAALLVLVAVLRPYHGQNPATIELARDAQGFAQALADGWRSSGGGTCGVGETPDAKGASINRLRCHLFVDSLAFVPGYVGLLVLLTLALARRAGIGNVWLRHLLCVPAVAAGLFDIAENGITIVAAEELLLRLLSDATVLDVRLASLIKWWLAGLAFAGVGVLALLASRRTPEPSERRWLRVGGGLAAAGAVLLAAALGVASAAAIDPRPEFGMAVALLAALALGRWHWLAHAP